MERMRVRGSLFVLQLFDVSEAIRLEVLREIPGGYQVRRERDAKHSAQTQVWFEPPPAILDLGEIEFMAGERFQAEFHFYSYGVISLCLERAVDMDWEQLTELCSRWVAAPAAEAAAAQLVQRQLTAMPDALLKPYNPHLSEDYVIIRLDPLPGANGVLTARELLEQYGGHIAELIRGESAPLAPEEQARILDSRLSYYPGDLIVAGWSAAVVYDTASGAKASVELIEYANTQLLEFRFYDDQLTRTLRDVYRLLDEGTGLLRRWRLASEAERLNATRLDVHELTERIDNAVKFLSDMFAARLYELVAIKVGVPDYRRMVDQKLRAAGELYSFMNDRFHQSSALFLETVVVIILIIELVFLFRGKG